MHRPSQLRTARSGATSGADRPPRPVNTAAWAHGPGCPRQRVEREHAARGAALRRDFWALGRRQHHRELAAGGPCSPAAGEHGSGSGPSTAGSWAAREAPGPGWARIWAREREHVPRGADRRRAGVAPGCSATGRELAAGERNAPGLGSGRPRGVADRPRRRARHRKNDWVPTGGPGNAKHRKGVPRRRRGRRRLRGYPFVRVYVGG